MEWDFTCEELKRVRKGEYLQSYSNTRKITTANAKIFNSNVEGEFSLPSKEGSMGSGDVNEKVPLPNSGSHDAAGSASRIMAVGLKPTRQARWDGSFITKTLYC